MSALHLWFEQVDQITDRIITTQQRLIYLSGASASGKSYIAEELVLQLQAKGKKVLLISSDSYYANDSQIKYLLYGTYDHPQLIDYDLLANDLNQLFNTNHISIPTYSFVEKRRTHLTPIHDQFDVVIVEGLYTIDQLPNHYHDNNDTQITAYKISVHSSLEEIIMRRIIRDQERVKEPIHSIIWVMSNVFPMRNLFGKSQESQADCIVRNDYAILSKEWKRSQWSLVDQSQLPQAEIYTTHHVRSYIYNDSDDDNGKIIISEVCLEENGLLDHVILQKRSSDPRQDSNTYDSISINLYAPGISTELHTLFQLAWLQYEWQYDKIVTHYISPDDRPLIIKEKFSKYYILQIE